MHNAEQLFKNKRKKSYKGNKEERGEIEEIG